MKAITRFRWLIFGAICASAAYWPLQVAADDAVEAAVEAAPAASAVVEMFGSAAVVSESLDDYRGGTDLVVLNDIKSDGMVRDNQASNLTTGNNWITEGSFTGAAGFPTVVQNSGNNVLIQNATIINLQVQ